MLRNILGLQCYKSAIVALKEHKEIMKSRFRPTANDDRLDRLTITEIHFEEHSYVERMLDR